MSTPVVCHHHVEIDGVRIFYRETGPGGAPTMLLLHGFPSASHQFRRLIDALGHRFHLVAPDYPGFGHSAAPDPASFEYSFDHLAGVLEEFCQTLGLTRFVLYVFDYGAPLGFRLATLHPEWIAGLVVQNGNAYEEGLSAVAQDFAADRRGSEGAREQLVELLTVTATRSQYEEGASQRHAIAPDGWTLDQHFLDLPGRKEIQVALALDYHSNVALYPSWQSWLRRHQPSTLIVWGRNDPFFTEGGARAYLRDVPHAELHLFDTGHFALEEALPEIAPLVGGFLARHGASG